MISNPVVNEEGIRNKQEGRRKKEGGKTNFYSTATKSQIEVTKESLSIMPYECL